MFNEMPTLQSANQHRKNPWFFEVEEESRIIKDERNEGGKAKGYNPTKYQKQCAKCLIDFSCGSSDQKYCCHECYAQSRNTLGSMVQCMCCLQSLGYGIKTIGKVMAMNYNTVRIKMIRGGVYNPRGSNKTAGKRELLSSRTNALDLISKDSQRERRIRRNTSRLKREFPLTPIQKARVIMRRNIKRVIDHIKGDREMRTEEYIGCSFNDAMIRLESQFKNGMKWDNHGTKWTIDHVVPLSAFDLTNPNDRRMANHISNLRPMLRLDNIRKGSKEPANHQFDLI